MDYKKAYEAEKRMREEVESKMRFTLLRYNELVELVRPLLTSIQSMTESIRHVDEIMEEYREARKRELKSSSGLEDSTGDGHEV